MKFPLVSALALALGACAATPATIVTHQYVDHEYYRGNGYNAAVRDGLAPVTVIGAPFPGIAADAALAPLKPPGSVAARGFAPSGDNGSRVVLVFNPRGPLARAEACAPAGQLANHAGTSSPEGGFVAIASLCQGGRMVSTAMVHAPSPTSVADPAYAAIVGQLLVEILPLTMPREVPDLP